MSDDNEAFGPIDLGDVWELIKRAPKVEVGDMVYMWAYNQDIQDMTGVLGIVVEHLAVHIKVELIFDGDSFCTLAEEQPEGLGREGLPDLPMSASPAPIMDFPVWAVVQKATIQ